MDRAPLRPVPSRPPGPVDPEAAVGHTAAALAGLDEPAVRAFALVALAGSSRADAAVATGLAPDETAAALARARKALRRSAGPLPGSGWCERAERLISDRIDGELEAPGPARLEVHLRNCPRCVEHERRLVQATDSLVSAFAPPPAAVAQPVRPSTPPLSVVRAPAPESKPFGAPVRLEVSTRPTADRAWTVTVTVGLAAVSLVIAVIAVIAVVLALAT